MLFRVFFEIPFSGKKYQDIEATGPRGAADIVRNLHKLATVHKVQDMDGNVIVRFK